MRVCGLNELPCPPQPGQLTLEESEGYFYSTQETPRAIVDFHRDTFPELAFIKLQDELSRPSNFVMSAKGSILRQPSTDWYVKLCDAYLEQGLYGLLDYLSSLNERPPLSILAHTARLSLGGYYYTGRVYTFLRGLVFPQLQLSPEEICSRYSEVSSWKNGFVRALAWHPGTKKLLIALRNDSVILYTKNSATSSELKHPKQTNVTCAAFRPFSGSHIAVGCENGLILWNIPASITVKIPTMHSASVLLNGTLVSSIQWHPNGDMLAVCSARFGDIKMVNPATGEVTPLTTISLLPSAHLLRWARDGYRLFAACPNGGFTVWEGNPVWDITGYYATGFGNSESNAELFLLKTAALLSIPIAAPVVNAACWSYDGCHLIYTVRGESLIYHLSLNPVGEPMAAKPRPKVIIDLNGHPDGISGEVSLMDWDRNCQRLVVAFKEPTPLIAVFRTRVKPLLSILPHGYFRGPAAPEAMKFCDDHQDGALLTVCWGNGVVQHLPMHFEVSAADRSVVLSRSAVSEMSGDFSDESRFQSPKVNLY